MSIMDNSAVERIARPDLSEDTLALLGKHGDNDNVVFFLGRLAWQGRMTECVPALKEIACDPARGRYGRFASIRAVMSCGSNEQKDSMWATIAGQPGPLDRLLLAELLDGAAATTRSVLLMLGTLDTLEPPNRFESTGLDRSIHAFIARLPIQADEAGDQPLGTLVEGLNRFLAREPFIERGECHVSEAFAWLMPAALQAVDRLVASRSAASLDAPAIEIMRNFAAVRFWRGDEHKDLKTSLGTNVPRWRELNDLLYWTSIDEARARKAKKGDRLTDDWQIAFAGHFWAFGPEDFERCLEWVRTKDGDDRLVAMSRCIQIFVNANRPAAWRKPLTAAAADDPALSAALEARLKPKASPEMRKINAQHRRWERKHAAREKKDEETRADWVRELRENPDRVRHPDGMNPGDFTGDQYHLLLSTMEKRVSTTREDGANWQALIPEFGEEVARAYRDAAIAHWRVYEPGLRSEGAETGSTPYALLFGMTGLAIEATEHDGFAQRLSGEEAERAFRYMTWELNGFPKWLETLFRAHPSIGLAAVEKELRWELENCVAGEPMHYISHDILYHAPWLHAEVAPLVLSWLHDHDIPNADVLRYCLAILTGGNTGHAALAALAAAKVHGSAPSDQRPRWFALWVDTDPTGAIPELRKALEALDSALASAFAEEFIVSLLGERHGAGARVGAYRTAGHLKALYILMHDFVRVAEDIDRMGKGTYSPTTRDDAQRGRHQLFELLSGIRGPEAYAAIKALETEHPESGYRQWMAERASARATADADEPLWMVEQMRDFAKAPAE